MKVYILSTYEEHGAFNVVATLDRQQIVPLICLRFPDFADEAIAEAVAAAKELLAQPDQEKGGMCNLNKRWAGIQLHVVNIEGQP